MSQALKGNVPFELTRGWHRSDLPHAGRRRARPERTGPADRARHHHAVDRGQPPRRRRRWPTSGGRPRTSPSAAAGPTASSPWRCWPFLLAGAMVLFDRAPAASRPASLPSGVRLARLLLLLSTIAVLSHPVLDTLNTYGVRWLMPFSGRWFYGDTLFIVDPWIWLALGVGVVLSRPRQARNRPARVALRSPVLRGGHGWRRHWRRGASPGASWPRCRGARWTGHGVTAPVNPFRQRVVVEQGASIGRRDRLAGCEELMDPASVRIFPRGRGDHPAVGGRGDDGRAAVSGLGSLSRLPGGAGRRRAVRGPHRGPSLHRPARREVRSGVDPGGPHGRQLHGPTGRRDRVAAATISSTSSDEQHVLTNSRDSAR